MKIVRISIAAAVVAAAMVLPTQVASAATTTVTVSPDNLNGWQIDKDHQPAPPNGFVAGPSPLGTGSFQFGPIAADPASSKMIVEHRETIAADTFGGLSVDYYINPAAANKSATQYYVNVYTQVAGSATTFYDCRYDYVATDGANGWHTLTAARATAAGTVTARANGTAEKCGASLADLAGGSILNVVLNAGDTSAGDAGIQGGFDNVVVTAAGNTTTYDFEPAVVVPPTPCIALPTGRVGTAGHDVVRGTAAADRIDLKAGNDVADGAGGNDCILGGDGHDVLRGAAGDDEISGGAGSDVIDGGDGADIINPGAGRDVVSAGAGDDTLTTADGEVDVVDCGAGTDTVVADRVDVLRNCENVARR